jgi:hypothetical protein
VSVPVTLEPIHGLTSKYVILDGQCVGILYPPKTSEEPWEYWPRAELVAYRFSTETEALAALGIAAEEEGRKAA